MMDDDLISKNADFLICTSIKGNNADRTPFMALERYKSIRWPKMSKAWIAIGKSLTVVMLSPSVSLSSSSSSLSTILWWFSSFRRFRSLPALPMIFFAQFLWFISMVRSSIRKMVVFLCPNPLDCVVEEWRRSSVVVVALEEWFLEGRTMLWKKKKKKKGQTFFWTNFKRPEGKQKYRSNNWQSCIPPHGVNWLNIQTSWTFYESIKLRMNCLQSHRAFWIGFSKHCLKIIV